MAGVSGRKNRGVSAPCEEACAIAAEDLGWVAETLISSGEPGFVLDSDGTEWPFYRETVERISVLEIN